MGRQLGAHKPWHLTRSQFPQPRCRVLLPWGLLLSRVLRLPLAACGKGRGVGSSSPQLNGDLQMGFSGGSDMNN